MKRAPSNLRLAAVTAYVLAANAAVAVANEAAHAAEGSHEGGADVLGFLFSFVNFAIFLFLLNKYAWPAVKVFLTTRRKEVADAMAAAEEARAEAEAIRRDYAAKEAALEETRRRMLEEIRKGAAADRERLLTDAEAAAERLRAEAERQAEHDLARARRELRAEAARLAAELAEKEVRTQLTDADRARLVREFVEGATRS